MDGRGVNDPNNLLERFDHVVRRGGPTHDPPLGADHLQGRRLELGEIALGGVLDQQALVAAIVRLAHRGLDADLGGHARDDQVGDAERRQPGVEPRR